MKTLYVIFIHLLLISCTSTSTDLGEQANIENVFYTTGAEQFFLSDAPQWMNFSTAGSCFRKKPIRYLNFELVYKNYGLSYTELIQLQYMFNRRINEHLRENDQTVLAPKDEAYIFYNMYQKVVGGSYDFIIPNFNQINLIWIDPYLNQKDELKRLFKNEKIFSGFPIMASHCLSFNELESLARNLGIDNLGMRYLSAEMLSIYDKENKKMPYFSFDATEFFKNKAIYMFSKKDSFELKGNYKFKSID